MVPERGIRIKSITEIPFGFGPIIDYCLKIISSAFPDDLKAQETAGGSVDIGQEVDSVFLSPIKVNSSSSSAFSTCSGTGAGGRLSACALAQLATL
jgi:hypothetical protein